MPDDDPAFGGKESKSILSIGLHVIILMAGIHQDDIILP